MPTTREPTPQEPTTRGRTNVPSSVIAKIAQQAAFEVPGVGAAAGGFLGIGAHREFDSRPTAQVETYGNIAVVRLDIGLGFPVNLADALQRVRTHVTRRVHELAGHEVGHMDITVSWLQAAASKQRELL
ncbi:Asp23/Gls24 family envelope stress response protein [Corynebacterium sp.]|uniref:Asp23/Gls24 family envelope stress response protein n=1 Tax=Corynebacterium sp. TaxID=1720 RepID=UPI0026DD8B1E|nr:Asp23/Gls24 family envelope stress response protein [Corynebacterium sp.]MDO5077296.1 Asp23/Gls24 family envelope stress response protein [Corynebacterium sp.]